MKKKRRFQEGQKERCDLIIEENSTPKSLLNKLNLSIIDWNYISSGIIQISEDFMREFQDKLDWDIISTYQELTIEFVEEFQDKINFNNYAEYNQYISEDIVRKFIDRINLDCLLNSYYVSENIKNLIKIYQ